MNMNQVRLGYPDWQQACLSVVLEMRPDVMKSKLSTAQAAIQKRLMDTRHMPDTSEQEAITAALSSLSSLKGQ